MYSLEKLDSFSLPLPSTNHTHNGEGKWSQSATKNLDASLHKLFVTTDAIFIAFQNSLQIFQANSGEGLTLTRHNSPINALDACAEGLAVSCSHSEILLYHFDSLLKEWEVTPVSEGEGRIFTLSIVVVEKTIFICAFKREEIVVYSADSLHQLCEPGPLILDKIFVLATIEKGRETISHSSAFYREEDHTLCLLAVGNPTNLKFWAIPLKTSETVEAQLLKFSSSGIKTMVEFGVFNGKFALLVGSEGTVELYALHSKSFNLLHKMVIEGQGEDWSVLGASIFTALDHTPFEKEEEDTLKPPNPVELPRFLFFILSSQGLDLVDAKSGVKFGASLSLQNILGSEIDQVWVQGAGIATDGNELLLVLQPNLLPLLHCSKIKLTSHSQSTENSNEGISCSLLSSEPLNPKSVLRRRIKSPPPPPKRKSKSKPRRAAKPTWATNAKLKVKSAQKIPPPESARSRSCSNDDKPIRLEAKGSYEDNSLDFNSAVELGERLSASQSTIRLAFSGDGRFLSAGGSVSPLVVMKTRPVWNITQRFKEIGRITSLHFNFGQNILLVGCNEGVTRILDFTGKELLSFQQMSKFNEQLHSQFYFMDKFILQPNENVVNLYAIKELNNVVGVVGTSRSFIKLQAATFPFNAQNISALAAANQFLSHQIVTGLSNKSLELFDVNVEKISLTLPSAHARPASCIRINEAPKGSFSSVLTSDVILSSAPCAADPIKLWDLRCARCVLRISDVNANSFVGNSRPALSPCGRFIASGFEENSLVCYDTRKLVGRLSSVTLKSSVLDVAFHPSAPILVAACRNGRLWGFPA